jgi:hypothetical protein
VVGAAGGHRDTLVAFFVLANEQLLTRFRRKLRGTKRIQTFLRIFFTSCFKLGAAMSRHL